MALESSKNTILSTDTKYFFLENNSHETDGFESILDLFDYRQITSTYLGYDQDTRFPLLPKQLLTFNTEMELI